MNERIETQVRPYTFLEAAAVLNQKLAERRAPRLVREDGDDFAPNGLHVSGAFLCGPSDWLRFEDAAKFYKWAVTYEPCGVTE